MNQTTAGRAAATAVIGLLVGLLAVATNSSRKAKVDGAGLQSQLWASQRRVDQLTADVTWLESENERLQGEIKWLTEQPKDVVYLPCEEDRVTPVFGRDSQFVGAKR